MLIATRGPARDRGGDAGTLDSSLIANMFPDAGQRTVAIGIWVTSYSLGGAIGPILGGIVLEHFRWGAVFLIGVPVMVLLHVLGPILLPEFRDPDAGRLDLLSAALSLVAVLSVIYGLKRMAEDGLEWLPVLSMVVGIAVGFAFVRRQLALADPLIDLPSSDRPPQRVAVVYMTGTFGAFGIYVFITQYLRSCWLSPLRPGCIRCPDKFIGLDGRAWSSAASARRT
jgi:DHA2 family multidrug resistance protein-like MFS transporter